MASAFARASIGSPTGPDGLPGDPAAEAERLAVMAMRYAEARAAQAQSMELEALHGTPSQARHCVSVHRCLLHPKPRYCPLWSRTVRSSWYAVSHLDLIAAQSCHKA